MFFRACYRTALPRPVVMTGDGNGRPGLDRRNLTVNNEQLSVL